MNKVTSKLGKKKNKKLSVKGRHLTADDNDINRFIVKTFLEKEGYDVVDVEDGKYVLELIKNGEKFDMIWLDLKMPHTDGVTCAKKLRSEFGYRGPIVGVTAHIDDVTLEQCYHAGFSTVISKPITEEVIKKCAEDFFFQHKLKFFRNGCQIPICSALINIPTD